MELAGVDSFPEGELTPAWSPDGLQIAFKTNGEICFINADGSGLKQLTSSPPTSKR